MYMFGSEKRTQKAPKEECEVFSSHKTLIQDFFGQKEGLHLSIPRGFDISRIATSGRGVGVGRIHKIASLVPRLKSKKES